MQEEEGGEGGGGGKEDNREESTMRAIEERLEGTMFISVRLAAQMHLLIANAYLQRATGGPGAPLAPKPRQGSSRARRWQKPSHARDG